MFMMPRWIRSSFCPFLLTLVLLGWSTSSSAQNLEQFDLDVSGEINASDLVRFIAAFLDGTNSVDFNQDQLTDGLDAFDLARNWKIKAGNRLGAPDLNPTSTTGLLSAVEFLFTGDSPLQEGVDPGVFEATRVVVLRGKVFAQDGSPLPDATVRVFEHPGYGFTRTREDGEFDMVVNGGGMVRVALEKEGYLPLQRRIRLPWQDYLNIEDVCLTRLDPNMTAIDLSAGGYQMAEGSEMTDADGTRRACILFPPGTNAEAVMPDGSSTPLGNLAVRATEFTVGDMGPMAMPAVLPPQSGYTYCVEYSVDEALSMGASSVEFNQPLYHYNENFLDFPTGSTVPTGYYDREKGTWIASPNGLVIEILSIDGDLAAVDVDGSGAPAGAQALADLNLTEGERRTLAAMYSPGETLWRVPISHFTPWDCNWPYGPPDDADPPPDLDPFSDPVEEECEEGGSIIDVHNLNFGEDIPIAGSPFSLHYRTDRVAGNKVTTAFRQQITGATVPVSLDHVRLEISAGGMDFTREFDPSPNQEYLFEWPAIDAYGRRILGSQSFAARLCFRYPAVYLQPGEFAQSFSRVPTGTTVIGERGNRNIISLCRTLEGSFRGSQVLGKLQAITQGFGGWTLNIHHSYDPVSRTLHQGDGTDRHATSANLPNIIRTVLHAPSSQIREVVVAPDGGVYYTDDLNAYIRKLEPDGTVTIVAGNGSFESDDFDNVPATETSVRPYDLYLGPDGCLYFSESASRDTNTLEYGHNRVRKIDREGIVTTVAGNTEYGAEGDGGPALEASLGQPRGIAVGADGSVYLGDTDNHRIRKVFPDGTIDTIAGTGTMGFSGDGGPAIDAELWFPGGLDVSSDGTVIFADTGNARIRQIDRMGIITTVAGGGSPMTGLGDFGRAVDAAIGITHNVRFGPDEQSFYIPDFGNRRVRQVLPDRTIVTVVGGGDPPDGLGDGLPGPLAELDSPDGVDWAPDGSLYVADWNNRRIRKLASLLPGYDAKTIVITSRDAAQQFIFDENGKHLETLHAWTGELIYRFDYNDDGYLIGITDAYDNMTEIERDDSNLPVAIVAPFGQRTELAVGPTGYLEEIHPPLGNAHVFEYQGSQGLLTQVTDPRGNSTDIEYDEMGRIARHEDRGDGFRTFEKSDDGSDFEVLITTALGATREHEVITQPWGERTLIDRAADSTEKVTRLKMNGEIETTLPSGQVNTVQETSDPRWGLQAPYLGKVVEESPFDNVRVLERTKEVALEDPEDAATLQRLSETIRINGHTYEWVYDAEINTVTLTSPMGRSLRYRIDELGDFTEYQRGDLAPVRIALNQAGDLHTLSQGSGDSERVFTYGYGPDGYPNGLTDPLGRTTAFEYDEMGRETSVTLPGGLPFGFGYDDNDNVVRIAPPGRQDHVFTYTARDELESYVPPMANGESTVYNLVYDLDGELVQELLPDGRSILYETQRGSCQCGNLEAMTTDRGVFNFEYDPTTSQRSSVTTPENETLTYGYEGEYLSRVTWAGTIDGRLDYLYDDHLRTETRRVEGAADISLTYDEDGLVATAGPLQVDWRPDVPLLAGTVLGAVTDSYTYNEFGEVVLHECYANGTGIYSASFTRDKMGRVSRLRETIEGEENLFEYDYDPSYRLTEARQNSATTFSCTYDDNENRISIENGVGAIVATYDEQDRLLSMGDRDFEHSPNGEIVSITNTSTATSFDYDSLGNLMGADLPSADRVDYILDGEDRRIGKRVEGVLVQGFLYQDPINPIVELDGQGNILGQFVYATHAYVPDYINQGLSNFRIVRDHLGSVRLVVDTATGDVLQRIDYDPLGRVTQDTNPGFQPFGYAGGIYDRDTGLVKLGAREYDPTTGRWTSKDSTLFGGGSNVYAYAENDPINLADPLGAQAGPTGGGPGLPSGKEIEQLWNETFKKIDEFVNNKRAREEALKKIKERAEKLARRTKPSKAAQKAMQKSAQDAAKQSTNRCTPIFFLEGLAEHYLRMLRCESNPGLPGCFPEGA